jgi:hypothetical protein
VQYLSQNRITGKSHIGQSLVETSDRAAIHFFMLAISAVHPDHGGLAAAGVGVRGGSTERLSPVSGKALDMAGVETVAEGVGNHLVRHHATMPGVSKTAKPFGPTRGLEDSLHVDIVTIAPCLRKTITAESSAGELPETGGGFYPYVCGGMLPKWRDWHRKPSSSGSGVRPIHAYRCPDVLS